MTVTFYTYNDRIDVPNKVAHSTLKATKDVSEIQLVNDRGCQFLLNAWIDSNYAMYSFGNRKYVATVSFLSVGDGMYQYRLTVDPLATAWENGLFNSYEVCERSNEGTVLYDNELVYSTTPTITQNFLGDNTIQWYAVVNILSGVANDEYFQITNPAITSYVLNLKQYEKFFTNFSQLSPLDQKIYGPSILSIRFVDTKRIPPEMLTTPTVTPNSVILNSFNNVSVGRIDFTPQEQTKTYVDMDGLPRTVTTVNSDVFVADNRIAVNSVIGATEKIQIINPVATTVIKSNDIAYSFNVSAANILTNFTLKIPNAGQITFSARDIPYKNITRIGYDVSPDVVGGEMVYFLTINGNRLRGYELKAPIPGSAPMPFDSSVTNWTNVAASSLSSIISGAASAVSGNPVGAVLSLISAGGAYASANLEEKAGGYSTSGALGWSPYSVGKYESVLITTTYPAIAAGAYQQRKGKPDGAVRKLSELTGYVRTKNSTLVCGGLAEWIVDETRRQLDSGVYIL